MTKKRRVLLGVLSIACVAATAVLTGQDDVKFLKEQRDQLRTICLITHVDARATGTDPRVVVDRGALGRETVKIIGTSITLTRDRLRALTREAVTDFDGAFSASRREALVAAVEWPFLKWHVTRGGTQTFTVMGPDASKIWASSDGADRTLEQLAPLLEERKCQGLMVLSIYHKAGVRARGILAKDPSTVAYAGVRVQMVDAKTRKLVYRRLVFSDEIFLKSPNFAPIYVNDVASVLSDFYTDITAEKFPDVWGAAATGNRETVQMLLDIGMSPEARDKDGRTALYHAAKAGDSSVVQLLREAGAGPIGAFPELERQLRQAAEKPDLKKLQALIDAGLNLDSTDANDRTALFVAAEKGRADAVAALLAGGARRDARTIDGQVPLDIAKSKRHVEVIRLLEAPPASQP